MNGLVFGRGDTCTPSVIPPATSTPEPIVAGDGFFPAVEAAVLRRQARILDKVTPERLREAILGAMVTAGIDLGPWSIIMTLSGFATLADVPSPRIGGESRLLVLYRRAIACFVKAELVERNPDMDATGAGKARAGDLDPTADELRRDGRYAIRDMVGRGRTDVELI